ncbi:class I SAM-dependent methyltransferase [Carboxylicivirga sp. A043]|uniref:class I SAM-dependent methyltransferase n=1 Tax=Carboxylicivirga litoralis TaxID=2816963 RepID=UPI0021CB92CC|nr:class I SAM-dependent methyltransferase [Carboxylicivirga sp. A043]MCU4157399.1 class I SAM-dependent methyltransferase [Carboxylicivirga sp. A043]
MIEFWEANFRDKKEMWGFEPADCAITALELFKKYGLNKILIPGFGYGRNASIFTDNGFDVTGIEISETAIDLAKKHYGDCVKVHHGSVLDMPFEQVLYDGVFCYALIHLLSEEERKKLISDCYNQLKSDGYMVFIALSKIDIRYGQGKEISKDAFETKHGVTLFFYDSDSVKREFGEYGLVKSEEICEPALNVGNKPSQKFMKIICRKENN